MSGKYAGYYCCHIPIELITASGLVPFRLNGLGDFPEKSYSYFPGNFCMFTRSCLNQSLTLDSESFAGLIIASSCDSMERFYDIVKKYTYLPFVHLLDMPRKTGSSAARYFTEQITCLKEMLEHYTGSEISSDKIKEAIFLYNENRGFFRKIELLRRDIYIPSSYIMDIIIKQPAPAELNIKLKEILNKDFEGTKETLPRVMISGSAMEDLTFINLIESSGAQVVYEDFCFLRHVRMSLDTQKPPLEALSEGYLHKSPCARMCGSVKERLKNIKEIIANYSVDGIIFYLIKFCDIFSWDIHMLVSSLRSMDIPVLVIEGDYPVKARGQLASRIRAFIEMFEDRL